MIGKKVGLGFADAERRITEEPAKVGLGILTEIDVQATMKKKLGLEMAPCKILGAGNPGFASKAIAAEPQIGALLPCNAVVRQDADGGVHVEPMDPNAVPRLTDRPEVEAPASEVRQRLEPALAQVS